ncbi:MAG: pirin family protein [Burkholderiales bacterium]
MQPGSVQWMTAGRGIVHSEMPEQENGLMWGFQLWVNLPAKDKMTAPRYQDIAPEKIPEVEAGQGERVRVIAGDSKTSPVPCKRPRPIRFISMSRSLRTLRFRRRSLAATTLSSMCMKAK